MSHIFRANIPKRLAGLEKKLNNKRIVVAHQIQADKDMYMVGDLEYTRAEVDKLGFDDDVLLIIVEYAESNKDINLWD